MTLFVIGGGPGSPDLLTIRGRQILEESDFVFAPGSYIESLGIDAEESSREKHGEVVERAAELASEGSDVAVVSGGDPGVYGKSDLVLKRVGDREDLEVEIVPGVTAVQAASAVLGAPLASDLCTVSLSGERKWDTVERRLKNACMGGFAIGLYNPFGHWERALDLLRAELGGGTVAIATELSREGSSISVTDVEDGALDEGFERTTLVLVPGDQSVEVDGWLLSRRG